MSTSSFPERGDVLCAGRGDPVVLLHSSMGSKSQWRGLVDQLSERWCALAVDLHGYGRAPQPEPGAFTLDVEVDRLEQMLDERFGSGARLHVVGHSYGGAVALRWAHRCPHRIRSLSLYEPTSFHALHPEANGLAEVRAAAARVTEALREDRLIEGARAFIDFWSGPGTFDAMPEARQTSLSRLLPKVRLDFEALFGASAALSDYASLAIPTLLMGGRCSPAGAQQILLGLAARWRSATAIWMNAGHMGPITDAHKVDPLIGAWLRRVESRETAAITPTRESQNTLETLGMLTRRADPAGRREAAALAA